MAAFSEERVDTLALPLAADAGASAHFEQLQRRAWLQGGVVGLVVGAALAALVSAL